MAEKLLNSDTSKRWGRKSHKNWKGSHVFNKMDSFTISNSKIRLCRHDIKAGFWLANVKKSSPLKLLGQMEPNLAGSIYVRSSIKLLHLVPFGQQTWPLLLKIEHMVKLHVFGNNSKTVNNIKFLKNYEKVNGWTPSDGNTSHDPLGQVS